jgi:RHH-type proline utilization regulon transcriptional repressor/proline dehydrogenase/delta 1-pyrroline-5-carboxylate dehydrogenase
MLELRRASVRTAALEALADLDARLPLEVSIMIGGEPARGTGFASVDPARPARVVAHAQAASAEQVGQALEAAAEGHRRWAAETARHRAATISRAAGVLRARRLELAALAVRECAKPWAEADADVCEAIDFLEYYALSAMALDNPAPLLQVPGERNTVRYSPRGVTAVIAPWNFPFAIATGMTCAALVTGNAVVLKPAEQAPGCADAVAECLYEAGLPRAALSVLPGGDEPGVALVSAAAVSTIAFTGSSAAGLHILEHAAKVLPGQRQLKRVIAEMGGKNCVIVDSDADLDEVVPAVLKSAFGFAGQKCSAASRLLVHEAVAEQLTARLAAAVATLRVGPPDDFSIDVPPVIDPEAQRRVGSYLAIGAQEASLTAAGPGPPDDGAGGFYVSPTVFGGLPAASRLLSEEIFGPVLTLEVVPDIATACDLVDAVPFALTGGLFSRSPRTIDYVSARSAVGNLYVNREITGAVVGRQPFGGTRLSGTGPQAGGPDYLRHFVQAHVVTENTMRHGLAI